MPDASVVRDGGVLDGSDIPEAAPLPHSDINVNVDPAVSSGATMRNPTKRGETSKVMREYDKDDDGTYTYDEVYAMASDFRKETKKRRLATKFALAMSLVVCLIVGLNAGLTAAIVYISKDFKVELVVSK